MHHDVPFMAISLLLLSNSLKSESLTLPFPWACAFLLNPHATLRRGTHLWALIGSLSLWHMKKHTDICKEWNNDAWVASQSCNIIEMFARKSACVRVSQGQTPMENTQFSNLKSMETLHGLTNCSLKDHAIITTWDVEQLWRFQWQPTPVFLITALDDY